MNPVALRAIPIQKRTLLRGVCLLALGACATTLHAAPLDFLRKKPKAPVVVPEPIDKETITRAQIYLDEQMFGPGKIDGSIGMFTRKAVAHYNSKRGITPINNWGPLLENARLAVPNVFTTYKLTARDLSRIDPTLPVKYQDQAERKSLPYRRISEFLAERFHSDENFIKRINPGVSLGKMRAGAIVKVPNVTPFRIEDVAKHQKFDRQEGLSNRHVIIDTTQKVAAIWEPATGALIASFPITPGKEKFIHRGDWTLRNMVTTPEFRYDKSMLEKGERSDEYFQLPPGPNSPVGIIWCGTSKSGIGLHGTSSPETIGRSRSAGCIRFANWDAIRLPTLFRPGAKITIR